MDLIAHRGNTNGSFESYENEPMYIDKAIQEGFDVEVDVWYVDGVLYLGHDKPQYGINFRWFRFKWSRNNFRLCLDNFKWEYSFWWRYGNTDD